MARDFCCTSNPTFANRVANDVENVELVFKDGVAFEPQKLLDSAKGRDGQY